MKTRRPKKAEPPWLAARRRDIELADERLGDFDDRRRWILDVFTARDPATIAASERAVWRDNLMALVLGKSPPLALRWSKRLHENEPLAAELPHLWRRIVTVVDAYRTSVDLPRLKVWFGRTPTPAEDARAKTPYVRMNIGLEAEDFETSLIYAVMVLLSTCTTLRECDECHRLFVATRRQKRHPKCARKFHDRNRPSRKKGTSE